MCVCVLCVCVGVYVWICVCSGICVFASVSQSDCLSVSLLVCLSVGLSVGRSVARSVSQFVCLSVCLSFRRWNQMPHFSLSVRLVLMDAAVTETARRRHVSATLCGAFHRYCPTSSGDVCKDLEEGLAALRETGRSTDFKDRRELLCCRDRSVFIPPS